ncbi:hypothetical protein KAR91_35015 [Candidatus Pacearchaeota archaeon]|nr:hypothetical protein [Candidatus Pacearchaeota archaeon]
MASCPKRSCKHYHLYRVLDCPYFRNKGCPHGLIDKPKFTKYGLSPIQQQALLLRQKGKCGICKCSMSGPQLDHDHQTGKARGYLCWMCTVKLFGLDNEEFKRKALVYLANPPA